MKVFVRGQGPVELAPEDFVGQGGQASVYAKGDVAYKLYTDPASMVPVGKLQELATIDDVDVIRPDALVLDHASSRAIGYTMRYVRDASPLCQLFPPAFRARHGLDAAAILRVVESLRERFAAVHRAGGLVVDANDMNFLVDASFSRVFAIDTDSYATPSYPASAVTPTILDPEAVRAGTADAPRFGLGSDHFAFAVLAFQLFVGVHPYRGKHPTVRTLSERMRAHLSAFDPAVSLPAVALPLDGIPGAYRGWLEAVLSGGRRDAPPASVLPSAALVALPSSRHTAALAGAANGVHLDPVGTFPSRVRAVHVGAAGDGAVLCDDGVYTLGGRRLADAPSGRGWVVFSPRLGRPVLATMGPAGATLRDLSTGSELEPPGRIDALAASGDRLVGRMGDALVELGLREVGTAVIVTPKILARVLPRATALHDGVAVQSLLGATYLSLFGEASGCRQVRVPELDGVRIVDARSERNVVGLLVADRGRYHRAVLRLGSASGHELRWVRDVEADAVELVALDSGVCLTRGDGRLEVSSAAPGSLAMRHLDDPRLTGVRLASGRGAALAFAGDVVYRLSSRA